MPTENINAEINIDKPDSEAIGFIKDHESEIDSATENAANENRTLIPEFINKGLGYVKENVEKIETKLLALDLKAGDYFEEASKPSTVASVILLFALAKGSSACTALPSSPFVVAPEEQPAATEVMENNEGDTQEYEAIPTVIVEPTATEMPPEVDLGWHNWMIFKDFWDGTDQTITEKFMKEHFDPENYDKPIYMFFTRDSYIKNDNMTFPYETTTPEFHPGWDYVEAINGDNVGLSLDLNDIEKEILKQYILFRKDEGKNLRLFLFIDDKNEGEEIRCFREQEGSLVVIRDSDNKKGFEVTIYEDEDIPWYELPHESWKGIKENNTMLDLRDGQVKSFCDMDDIKDGVDPR